MTSKGNHTWDIYIHYHECPHCGYINESRIPYTLFKDHYEKNLTCTRCKEEFQVTKKRRPTFQFFNKPEVKKT